MKKAKFILNKEEILEIVTQVNKVKNKEVNIPNIVSIADFTIQSKQPLQKIRKELNILIKKHKAFAEQRRQISEVSQVYIG